MPRLILNDLGYAQPKSHSTTATPIILIIAAMQTSFSSRVDPSEPLGFLNVQVVPNRINWGNKKGQPGIYSGWPLYAEFTVV